MLLMAGAHSQFIFDWHSRTYTHAYNQIQFLYSFHESTAGFWYGGVLYANLLTDLTTFHE